MNETVIKALYGSCVHNHCVDNVSIDPFWAGSKNNYYCYLLWCLQRPIFTIISVYKNIFQRLDTTFSLTAKLYHPVDYDLKSIPSSEPLGYASVRLFCTSTIFISSTFTVLRPLYFDLYTSTRVHRPFAKSGLLIGREVQVEVQFCPK